MQPILFQLETLDKSIPGLKIRIFEWIVDMPSRQFDQLCHELVALNRFQKKYTGALVTDAPHLIRPFIDILPRVELLVEIDSQSYDRRRFYHWLTEVTEEQLRQICLDLESLCDEALENVNSYVVDEKICADHPGNSCWRISLDTTAPLSDLFRTVAAWKK